jgi:hypothetical protein
MRSARHIVLRFFASRRIRYAVAGITLLFVIFLIVVIKNFLALTPEKLYHEAYVPFTVSTINGVYHKPSDSIEVYYDKGMYSSIIRLTKPKKNLLIKEELLVGLSFLQSHDFNKAIQHLQKVTSFNNPFVYDAQFYLALTYIINQDYDNAIEKVEYIYKSANHPYHSRFSKSFIRRLKLLKWK